MFGVSSMSYGHYRIGESYAFMALTLVVLLWGSEPVKEYVEDSSDMGSLKNLLTSTSFNTLSIKRKSESHSATY